MGGFRMTDLSVTGLKIIGVCFLTDSSNRCIYRVYTSDGGFVEYIGYEHLPEYVKRWMAERNVWEYIIPSCMFISGEKVV